MLKERDLAPQIPEDLNSLLQKARAMARHLEKFRSDHRNVHNMQLLESRVHGLSEYYKRKKVLPQEWKYKPHIGSFI